jgi:TRAP-type C4-dicarboxylate transport system permease small subunit
MKISKLIDFSIRIFGGVLLLAMVSLTFLQIVLRQFFNLSLNWSDEVSQFCMTWLALFGGIWATKNNKHLNTGFMIQQKFDRRIIHLIDSILALVIIGIAAVVAYQCAIFTSQQWVMESLSLRWLKMGYVFIALPIFMLATCYYYLKSFFKNVQLIFKKD